jgi:hypothetical protein
VTHKFGTWRVASGCAAACLLLLLVAAAGFGGSLGKKTGVFTVIHADARAASHRPDQTFYYLRTGGKLIGLRFHSNPKFPPGQKITVTGALNGNTIDVESATVAGPVVGQTTSGTHSVLIMMVDWTAPDSTTPAQAASQVGSTDNAWYLGTSYNQLGLAATATPWMTIPDSTQAGTTCNLGQIENDAETAATANGYTPSSYDHEMIYIPAGTPGCNVWAGQGEVNGRVTWIYGYMDTRVTTHELGHNLGLWHSHSLTCHNPTNSSVYVSLSSSCDPFAEYGDTWDDMGNCCFTTTPGQFNAAQKQNLAWMQGRVATATGGTQTFTIAPLEQSASATQAVRVQGPSWTYWLDYRQPINQDSYLSSYPGVTNGVEVHIPEPADGSNGTDLLDMTPNGSFNDEALPVGQGWTSPDGVTVTVTSATSSGATVTVTVPGRPPPPSNVRVVYDASRGGVAISFTNGANTTGDAIRRSAAGGACPATTTDGTAIGGTSLRTSDFDSAVTAGNTYCYSVFALGTAGPSQPASASLSIPTSCSVAAPGVPQVHFYQPSALTTGATPTTPEQETWSGSSTSGVTYTLQEQVNNGTWTTVSSGTTTLKKNFMLTFGNTYNFQVRATGSSCSTAWKTGVPFTVVGVQETGTTFSGSWSSAASTNYWGGTLEYTKAAGASATLQFTGRNIGVIGTMAPGNGAFKLYVDGTLKSTPTENASTAKYRQIVGKWGASITGTHTIKLVNAATSGHPQLSLDGFVIYQ